MHTCRFVIMTLMALAATALAAPVTQPSDPHVAAVMDILRGIQPAKVDVDAAGDALVKLGKDHLGTMRRLLEQPQRLVGEDELTQNRFTLPGGGTVVDMSPREERVKAFAQHRANALKAAIRVLEIGFDPVRVAEDFIQRNAAGGPGPRAGRFKPQVVEDASLDELLPKFVVCQVLVRQHPVAFAPPAPLGSHNLFFVARADRSVSHLTTMQQLEAFFVANLPPIGQLDPSKKAVRAWLTLAQHMATDGMYQFTIPDGRLDGFAREGGDGRVATGVAQVEATGGNSGQIKATLHFDREGKLTKIEQDVQLKAGLRPICQATKLLDPDPIVRRMAQQDLLVMGSAARDYLREQHAKASPQLRLAIEAVWQAILQREDRSPTPLTP